MFPILGTCCLCFSPSATSVVPWVHSVRCVWYIHSFSIFRVAPSVLYAPLAPAIRFASRALRPPVVDEVILSGKEAKPTRVVPLVRRARSLNRIPFVCSFP